MPSAYPRRETILRMDFQANSSTRVSVRWVNNQDDQQFAYGTTTASWNFPLTITDRKNGPGNTLSFTVTKNFGATLINEFTYGAGRGGVTIAPSDDKATRSVTGINTPLLYPDANTTNLIPSLNFGTVANSAATRQHLGLWSVRAEVRHQQLHRQPDEGEGQSHVQVWRLLPARLERE